MSNNPNISINSFSAVIATSINLMRILNKQRLELLGYEEIAKSEDGHLSKIPNTIEIKTMADIATYQPDMQILNWEENPMRHMGVKKFVLFGGSKSNQEVAARIKTAISYVENKMTEVRKASTYFAWGAPGIGKSSVIASTLEQFGEWDADLGKYVGSDVEMIDLRLSQLAPTDLRGLPATYTTNTGKRKATFAPTDSLPDQDSKNVGVLLLDEFNMATPAMQGLAQQLILDGKVGDYVLPVGWLIMGAGNRKTDQAAVNQMPAPVSNRFSHFDVSMREEEVISYAINHQWPEEITSFLKANPDMIHKFDQSAQAWPSPRSWAVAASQYHLFSRPSVAQAVGVGADAKFQVFLTARAEMPNITDICSKGALSSEKMPEESKVAANQSTLIALAQRWVIGETDEEKAKMMSNSIAWLSKQRSNKNVSEEKIKMVFKMLVSLAMNRRLTHILAKAKLGHADGTGLMKLILDDQAQLKKAIDLATKK